MTANSTATTPRTAFDAHLNPVKIGSRVVFMREGHNVSGDVMDIERATDGTVLLVLDTPPALSIVPAAECYVTRRQTTRRRLL